MDKNKDRFIGRMKELPSGEFKTPNREVWVYFGSDQGSSLGAGICKVPPGSNNERHDHPDGDEVIYVIKGTMHIELEGTIHEVHQADGIFIKQGQKHQIFNPSNDEELIHTFTFNAPKFADNIGAGYGNSDNFVIKPPVKND